MFKKKLRIWLPDDWRNDTHLDPDGLLTFRWNSPEATGALQISLSEYVSGALPNPSPEDLLELARERGEKNQWGERLLASTGSAFLGIYGTAAFRGTDGSFRQLWELSNGQDFVHVTFFGPQIPGHVEHFSAQRIVEGIGLQE